MDVNFPKLEEEVLEKWRTQNTFQKSLQKRKKSPRFVFYDGPPTANAGPGLHHMVNRVFKDVILRYKTMQGFFVRRKAGWDTHGLPVELQIEKKLGLKSKKEIEQYGIAKFNAECKKSVWEFKGEWEKFNERVGLWLDQEHPYITYDTSYIESLWFVIKKFWDKKLLYKDYKVVPYCARCGTPLSSHELAQGYKTVKDQSVYVKFKVKTDRARVHAGDYILAWTTTPWTLPGNVALAFGKDIAYVRWLENGQHYILAQELAPKIFPDFDDSDLARCETIFASDLTGLEYEPLFRFKEPESGKKIWEVVPADFVSVEDGTGIVHTAVAYGEDDFKLGKKENLAMLHLVDEEGKFTSGTWKGMFVKDADRLIIEDLKTRGVLLKEEMYEHEYPFCWRCSTPLLYYAKESWFVNMQKVKQKLIANNNTVNWIPSHIKKGRMGEWLKDVKDWAFSRERYWGTPLPVWQCNECKHIEVIGSIQGLLQKKFSSNSYYILRHGHSEKQTTDVMSSWPEKKALPLTEKGRKQVQKVALELKKQKIDVIISSDILRTKETAEIVGKELGIDPLFDPRLREWDVGELNGRPLTDIKKVWAKPEETPFQHYLRRFVDPMPGGEDYVDVQKRVFEFMKEMDKKYSGKSILLVSHERPLTFLEGLMKGFSREQIVDYGQVQKKFIDVGEMRKLPFSLLPYNTDMELDLHRPYVDEIIFSCDTCKEGKMQRVKEVVDVWFDSGAMPYAQDHWPFDSRSLAQGKPSNTQTLAPPKEFPADYIVEAIDQTRGWFYTLQAVATLLGFKSPYKNVISLGHVLDEKGNKMSKSKGNIVNPWDIAGKYGVEAARWYFFTINNPGDPKLFAEKDIQDAIRRFLLTLWNCFVFFDTYADKKAKFKTPKNVLDAWIVSRLQGTIQEVTKSLDVYDITRAARSLESFAVNDLSLWYVRRSRSRFQNPAGKKELSEASSVLGFVLRETTKLCAPFLPFLGEHLFEKFSKESVHLQDWPKAKKQDKALEKDMEVVRDVVAKVLAERQKAGIKVRQPLSLLKVKKAVPKDLLALIQDEVNVKEVLVSKTLANEVELDTSLTEELKQEGLLREIMRKVQGMRKDAGYFPKDKISLWYDGDEALTRLFSFREEELKRMLGIKMLGKGIQEAQKFDIHIETNLDGRTLRIGVKKV